MPIIATAGSGSTFTPHPEGAFPAVCADIHDLGMVEVTYKDVTKSQHKIDIYFYCGEDKQENGKPVLLDGKPVRLFVRSRFTLTLDERGRLRPFLESWRGKKFTADELNGFDVERLIGAPAFLQVLHNENNGTTYANIQSIMKLPKGAEAPAVPGEYVRFCDRPTEDEPKQAPQRSSYDDFQAPALEDIDDDLPF
jgi:hypothetical protein